jgi:hypothetical protein
MIGISGISREDRLAYTTKIVSREDSVLGIDERTSKYSITDAEAEYEKKKEDKIAEINTEIERRKTAFEII